MNAAAVRTRSARLVFTILALLSQGLYWLIVCGVALVRSVSKALNSMIYMVKDLAEGEGDLTKRLVIASHDELGELAQWFNTFLDKITALFRKSPARPSRWPAQRGTFLFRHSAGPGADRQKDQTTQVAQPCRKCRAPCNRFRRIALTRRRLRAGLPRLPAKVVSSWKKL